MKDKDNKLNFHNGQNLFIGPPCDVFINPDDMELYEHKFGNGFDEHFKLGPEDESQDYENDNPIPVEEHGLVIKFIPRYDNEEGHVHPCGDLVIRYNGDPIDPNDCIIQYYFDNVYVKQFSEVVDIETGIHNFKVVVTYNLETKIENKDLYYAAVS